MRFTKTLSVVVSAALIPLLVGCGNNKGGPQNSRPRLDEPVNGPLPDAHGPGKHEEVVRDERLGGAPRAPGQPGQPPRATTPSREDAATTTSGPAQPPPPRGRKTNMCLNAYDPNTKPPEGVRCPVCAQGEFVQPDVPQSQLDILFVADTSPSLETERRAIAAGIENFIQTLPMNTNLRVAVMAAHSDVGYDEGADMGNGKKSRGKSSSRLAGKLIGNKVLDPAKFNYDTAKLAQSLVSILTGMPTDPATDGGEAGLYSLNKGISEPLLSENRKLGFFRPGAALAVIFISDENDLCSYGTPDTGGNYPPGVTPKANVNEYKDPAGNVMTVEERATKAYCQGVNSRSVFTNLRNLQQTAPLFVSGVLYTEDSSVPTVMAPDEKFPQYFTENEKGYGYLDIIRDNNGYAVDIGRLSGGNSSRINQDEVAKGLREIGLKAAEKLEIKSAEQLKLQNVDEKTVCVFVNGQEVTRVQDFSTAVDGLSYIYNPELREIQMRGIGRPKPSGSSRNRDTSNTVKMFYCEPPDVIDFKRELFTYDDVPTPAEHYRNLPVPNACSKLKARINSGEFDR